MKYCYSPLCGPLVLLITTTTTTKFKLSTAIYFIDTENLTDTYHLCRTLHDSLSPDAASGAPAASPDTV